MKKLQIPLLALLSIFTSLVFADPVLRPAIPFLVHVGKPKPAEEIYGSAMYTILFTPEHYKLAGKTDLFICQAHSKLNEEKKTCHGKNNEDAWLNVRDMDIPGYRLSHYGFVCKPVCKTLSLHFTQLQD